MNKETKDFLEQTFIKYLKKVPTTKEELFKNEVAHIIALDIVDELCEALDIYEDDEEDLV